MRISAIICLLTIPYFAIAQQPIGIEKNTVKFLLKLHHQSRNEETLFYIKHLNLDQENAQSDSIQYIRSYCLMELGQYQQSASSLIELFKNERLATKSRLLSAYCLNQIAKEDSALEILKKADETSVVALFRSSTHLLKYDIPSVQTISNLDREKDTLFSQCWIKNNELCAQIPKPQKSALLAGLLSTVVPGMGKIYAGQKKDGLSTLFTIVPLGLLVYENIYHWGFKKPQTIIFGGIFVIFYSGNIIGSIYSPKAFYENQKKKFRQDVLSNLDFPLRSICKP